MTFLWMGSPFTMQNSADLPGFNNPSIVTKDEYRPEMLLVTSDNTLYVIELTVGHESNLKNNTNRKNKNTLTL